VIFTLKSFFEFIIFSFSLWSLKEILDVLNAIWSVESAFLVFALGAFLCVFAGHYFGLSLRATLILYLWHTAFCFAYVYFVLVNGGDALTYYERTIMSSSIWRVGTPAVSIIAEPVVNGLELSFVGANLFFNIFGSIGLLAFYGSLKAELIYRSAWIRGLAMLLVLMPSVSFWSSAIGKDSLSFMAAGLVLWSSLALDKRFGLMAFAILVMFLVRPHMAGILLLTLSASFLVRTEIGLSLRLLLTIVTIFCSVLLVPFALQYAGLGGPLGVSSVEAYIDRRQGYNMDGGGGVDIASMILPVKVFTYLFRPLPFEAHSIFTLASSFENIFILFITALGLQGLLMRRKPQIFANRPFLWLYVIVSTLLLAMTTANLGISVRQKWMFMPMLMFLMLSYTASSGVTLRQNNDLEIFPTDGGGNTGEAQNS
jgi:hypothetical protein